MSLINQMLQDLDARRSDVSGGNAFGEQIRAVAERRRFHPAWWVAMALGGMLAGVLGYVALRPASPMPQGMSTQLPLKLDIDLNAGLPTSHGGSISSPAERTETQNPLLVEPATAPTQASPEPAVAAKPVGLPAQAPIEPDVKRLTPKVVPQVKERPAASVPPAADVVPPAKALMPVPAVRATEVVMPPPTINKQVKELTPSQRAENEYRKAVLALQQAKRADAISGLEQALQVDPKHAGARQALIGLLLDGKQQDEAVQRAREGLNADPTQYGLAMILARLQLEKGELRAAIETLERTLPHASERAEYLAFLAALLQRDERHKQAVEHYLLALQKAPQNGVWWMGLGISLQAEHRNAEAQESFKRAKASNSLSPDLLAFVEARLSQLQQ